MKALSSILIAVLASGIYFGVVLTQDHPLYHPLYPQTNFLYPAIFFAAGLGMGTADIRELPELDAFIYHKASSFDTRTIPKDIKVIPLKTAFELTHIYYIYTIGWIWRILGVSVWGVVLYAALLRAFCSLALYGIFNLFLNRKLAILGTLLICTSPAMLSSAIDLRDFGKAPFILGILLGMGWLVRRPLSTQSILTLAAYLGVLLGVGMGFRQDVLICFPPVILTLFFFLKPVSPRKKSIRCAALLILVMVFAVVAMPVLRGLFLEGGQAGLHAFFHGVSPESESRLEYGDAAYDSLIAVDPAAYAIVSVFARRSGHTESLVNEGSSEFMRAQGEVNAPLLWDPYIYYTGAKYAKYANSVIWEMVWCAPADFAVRAWLGVFSLPQLPRQIYTGMVKNLSSAPLWLRSLTYMHGILASHLARYGLLYILLVLLAVSANHLWHAFYWTGIWVWFAGYPTLWYEYRHFFFLAFIPVLAMLLCFAGLFRFLFALRNGTISTGTGEGWFEKRNLRRLKCMVYYMLVMLAVILGPVVFLRAWQLRQVGAFAQQLAQAGLEWVAVKTDVKDGRIEIDPENTLPGLVSASKLPSGETAWEYVAVVLDTRGEDIPFRIQYDDSKILYTFTQDLCIKGVPDGRNGRVTLFFPVYETYMNYGDTLMPTELLKTYPKAAAYINDQRPVGEQEWWRRGKFLGVSMPEKYKDAFKGFYRVRDVKGIPILPVFQLPEDIRFLRYYKTGPWERRARHLVNYCRDSNDSF